MSKKKIKRVSISLTPHYYDFLEDLAWNGVYHSKSQAIRAAIRLLMKEHGAIYTVKKIEEAEK